jgi:tetratricopeptide (TPR) repeat protein
LGAAEAGEVALKSGRVPVDATGEPMSIIQMFKLGMRVAEWATPHVQEWQRTKNLNRMEGERHLQARNYAEAEKHLTLALQEKHSAKHQVEILVQLAKAQVKQGKLEPAEETARAALSAAGDHEAQWEAAECLTEIQVARGNQAEAARTLAEMELSEKERSQPDTKRLARASRQRGRLLLETGREAEGLAALEESARLSEAAWGAQDPEMAHSLGEIGAVQVQLGNQAEAQRLLRRALEIYGNRSECLEGASRSLQQLAMSLEASEEYSAAAKEYERFISMTERQIGGDRSTVPDAKVRLAALYIQAGRSAPARELLLPVIRVLERTPSAALVDALQVMAIAEDLLGRPEDAAVWRGKLAKLQAQQPS